MYAIPYAILHTMYFTLNVDACSGNRLWAKHVSDRDLPEVCDSLRLFREPVSTQDLFLKPFLEPQGLCYVLCTVHYIPHTLYCILSTAC